MGLTLQHGHSRNTSLRRQAAGDQDRHQNFPDSRDAVGQIKLRLSSKSSLLESVTTVGRVPAGVSWLPSLPQHSPVFLCMGPFHRGSVKKGSTGPAEHPGVLRSLGLIHAQGTGVVSTGLNTQNSLSLAWRLSDSSMPRDLLFEP